MTKTSPAPPRDTARMRVPAQRAKLSTESGPTPKTRPPLYRVAEYAAAHYGPGRADSPPLRTWTPALVWTAALVMLLLFAVLGGYAIAVEVGDGAMI